MFLRTYIKVVVCLFVFFVYLVEWLVDIVFYGFSDYLDGSIKCVQLLTSQMLFSRGVLRLCRTFCRVKFGLFVF